MREAKPDLYKIYKGFYGRSYVDAYCDLKAEMTELARRIVLSLFRSQSLQLEDRDLLTKIDEDCEYLIQLEGMISRQVSYAKRLKRALQSRNFIINIPYPILPLWQDHSKTNGTIYIFTSPEAPGLVKLGATTIDIQKRASVFSKRYHIPITIKFQKNSYDPFVTEKKIGSVFSELRTNGCSYGYSNEWYNVDARLMINKIEELAIPQLNPI